MCTLLSTTSCKPSPQCHSLWFHFHFGVCLFFLTILCSLQGSSFPDQGSNLWKLGVLTTGPPGNSPEVLYFFFNFCPPSRWVLPGESSSGGPNILLGNTIPVQEGRSQPQKSWEATVFCPEIRNTILWGQRHSLEVDLSAHLKAQTGCSDGCSRKRGCVCALFLMTAVVGEGLACPSRPRHRAHLAGWSCFALLPGRGAWGRAGSERAGVRSAHSSPCVSLV